MSEMVFRMIQEADMDTRTAYYKHIVLSGGRLNPHTRILPRSSAHCRYQSSMPNPAPLLPPSPA